MKIFVAIIKKKNSGSVNNFLVDDLISSAVESNFPVLEFLNKVKSRKWGGESFGVWAHLYTNEGEWGEGDIYQEDKYIIRLGYSDTPVSEIICKDVIRLDRIASCTGQFSYISVAPDGVDFVTDAVGTFPAYTAEMDDFYVISSRAGVVSDLCANLRKEGSKFDLLGCRDLALQGHYLSRRTGFEGVQSSAVHEHIRVSAYGMTSSDWLKKCANPIDTRSTSYQVVVDEVCNALVNSMRSFEGSAMHLSITGGRDSRLLAAVLSNLPTIQVGTATSGVEENPDVVLGKRIAGILGWPHKVVPPKIQELHAVVEDPVARVIRTLDFHDCSTSAWDECPDYGSYSDKPAMSGVGGEILRGGMTLIAKDKISPQEASQILRNTMCGGGFFTEDIQKESIESARPFLMGAVYDPYAALDGYYHGQRNHRWVCNRRNGARVRWNAVDPLLDNRVITCALNVPPEDRWTERLVFDVISRLCPALRDIPIEGERWRFERHKAHDNESSEMKNSWELRSSMKSNQAVRRFDWRLMGDLSFRAKIVGLIMDGVNGRCEELFDKKKLENYLKDIKYPTTVWHILTTVLFMNGVNKNIVRKQKNDNLLIQIV